MSCLFYIFTDSFCSSTNDAHADRVDMDKDKGMGMVVGMVVDMVVGMVVGMVVVDTLDKGMDKKVDVQIEVHRLRYLLEMEVKSHQSQSQSALDYLCLDNIEDYPKFV